MEELLTVDELAALLKMSTGQIYEMTRTRTRAGAMRENPIPVVKINGNVRFVRTEIEEWVRAATKRG